MLAGTLGRLRRFIVNVGQVGDITQAPALLEGQSGSALRDVIAKMGAEQLSCQTRRARSSCLATNSCI